MVEYALLVVLVAIVGISGLTAVGQKVTNMFADVAVEVGQAGGPW